VNKARTSDNLNYGMWMTNAEKLRGRFETGSESASYATSPLSYSDGNWHYAVVTFDGPPMGLYIDGVPVATKSSLASPDSGGEGPIRMGADRKVSTTISSDKQVAIFDVPESAADSSLVFKLTVTDDRDDSGADDVTVEVEQISQDESSSQGECN
jgi:Concanavalin A-like lectin/glucanases superfamily